MIQCGTCGKFMRCETGASWAMRFSGWPPTPDHEANQCAKCTKEYGPLEADYRTKAEMTAGVYP